MITEVELARRVLHDNIVRCYAHFEDASNIYLVMELAEGGNLYAFLRKNRHLHEAEVAKFGFQLLKAASYLHNLNPPIVHRDLKLENILIDSNGFIKLADFGWSSIKDSVRHTFCGTRDYLAPEMILKSGHDEKIDVWTIGILMFELLTGKAPFTPSV